MAPDVREYLNAFTISLAVHLTALVMLVSLATAVVRQHAPQPDAKPVRPVSIAWPPASTKPVAKEPAEEWNRPLEPDNAVLRYGTFSFDVNIIAERAKSLFPFLTNTLVLEPALADARRRTDGAGLVSPVTALADPSFQPPLMLDEARLQEIVDTAWTRRERWQRFQPIASLVNAHHPDAGQLPDLLRRYTEQNVLQPYIETGIRDPRVWAMLGLAAEHVDFIQFITGYVTNKPSSRLTTELLFLLDELAQGSHDTLLALVEIEPAKDLSWTRSVNPEAARLIASVRRYYLNGLEHRALPIRETLRSHYDAVRLSILETIVTASPQGYRVSDARYLIGAIHWKQRNVDEALRWWGELTQQANDRYASLSREIVAAISRPGKPDPLRIARTLERQRSEWSMFWVGRLKHFGYRVDRF